MTDRPILFSAPMVRAILNGNKTQTRRVIAREWLQRSNVLNMELVNQTVRCQYGRVGDRLWVREKWAIQTDLGLPLSSPQPIEYIADIKSLDQIEDYTVKPSIHMPRWASRITLEITNVRVERVRDISETDAWGEGIERLTDFGDNVNFASWRDDIGYHNFPTAREAYRNLWDTINAKRGYGWDANPFVWVVEFKVVQS